MLCKLIIAVQEGMPGVETRKVGSKDRQIADRGDLCHV